MRQMSGCLAAAFLVVMLLSSAGFCVSHEEAATATDAKEEMAAENTAGVEDATAADAKEEMAPEKTAGVEDAGIGTAVEDRTLIGQATEFPVSVGKVYCFTRITGAKGTTIKHVWNANGSDVAELSFSIGADSWRTWSSKQITPGMAGSWTVKVLAEDGTLLEELPFTITP